MRAVSAVIPPTWRREAAAAEGATIQGVGLGLYGLRTIPMVAREEERDRLWNALLDVRESNRPRALVVRGRSGSGKSRLVEWIAERAHELGAVTVIRAVHSPVAGPTHGIHGAITRHLGVRGLSRSSAAKRIARALGAVDQHDEFEALALAELTHPTGGDRAVVQFTSPSERHSVICRLLQREAARRPVLLWLDDVQWGIGALALTRFLLTHAPEQRVPVLAILTARDEAIADSGALRARIDALLAMPRTESLALAPLAAGDHAQLVGELLGLEGDLAVQVRRRTAGNPLFAVQLVGDWVQRGILRPGPRGFQLRPGARADIPDGIHDVWVRRLRAALHGLGPDAWTALELAAALGQDVDDAEWRGVCAVAGLAPPTELLGALQRSHLATRTPSGFRLVHAMLRESLEREARDAGSWAAHNRTCTRMLETRYGTGPRAAERLGRHLFAGGDLDECLGHLQTAAWEARAASQHDIAFELLEMWADALTGRDRPPSDPQWGHVAALRSILLNAQGRDDESNEVAEHALRLAEEHGWTAPLPAVLRVAGWASVRTGRLAEARERFQRGFEVARARHAHQTAGQCLLGQGYAALFSGDLDDTERLAHEAEQVAERVGDLFGVSEATKLLGTVHRHRGDVDEAMQMYSSARFGFERVRNRTGLAQVHNEIAEMARAGGDLETAEREYDLARSYFAATGSRHVRILDVNLALVRLARGDHTGAEPLLLRVLEADDEPVTLPLRWCTAVALMVCAAFRRDWTRWDELGAMARPSGGLKHVVEQDVALCARQAADLARAAGHHKRARPLYELAVQQFEALGQTELAAEIRASWG